jgi:hypothetical protein
MTTSSNNHQQEFNFVIIGTIGDNGVKSKEEAKQYLDKFMRDTKIKDINTIHIFC